MVEEICGREGCLALIIPKSFGSYGSAFATREDNALQVGAIVRKAGDSIPAHTHRSFEHTYTGPRQEFLHVVEGRMRVTILDGQGEAVAERVLETGDSMLQLTGGHRFDFEANTRLIEVKQGPYGGKDKDKQIHE
ncbi:MAG: hypothetical protein WCC36_05845 [Gammaproteobacteria bacterium]